MDDKAIEDYTWMYKYAKENGLEKTKELLRDYIGDGQPDDFMEGFTTRAMCRAAAHGLEGTDIFKIPQDYTKTKYGSELYNYMWGGY